MVLVDDPDVLKIPKDVVIEVDDPDVLKIPNDVVVMVMIQMF